MNEQEIEIDLKQLLDALLARLWMIVAVTLMLGAFAFFYSKFAVTPMYEAKSTIYVNSSQNVISNNIETNEISASSMMATVFVEMLKSNAIIEEVKEVSGVPYELDTLKSMISAAAVDETPLMKISVVSPNPKEAVLISNALLEVAPGKMTNIVDGGSIKIIDRPLEPTAPSSPNILKNTILGLMLGFLLSAGIVILMELLDTRIKDEEQLRNLFEDLPVLATIPEIEVPEE
ncbi:MAG: hypothetical protein IKS17_00580 [Firmicutes bacterium]|nr:hypothetical protein [Bacillota bacterium]